MSLGYHVKVPKLGQGHAENLLNKLGNYTEQVSNRLIIDASTVFFRIWSIFEDCLYDVPITNVFLGHSVMIQWINLEIVRT